MVHSLGQVMGVVPWFLLQCMYPGLGEVALDTQVPGGQGSSPRQLPEYSKIGDHYYSTQSPCEDQSLALYLALHI